VSQIKKECSFSRTLEADANLNAYYTDTGHAKRLGYLLSELPKEVCAFDPTCGDGKALLSMLEAAPKAEGTVVKTYGVEIMPEVAGRLKEEKILDYSLCADFINGTRITKGSFSLCFSNPPYGEGDGKKDRLEYAVIKGIYQCMCAGGVLMIALNRPQLAKVDMVNTILTRFSLKGAFKADDGEYRKWQQLFLVLIRKDRQGWTRPEKAAFEEALSDLSKIPYLPKAREEAPFAVEVPESRDESIEVFATVAFDAELAAKSLHASPLYRKLKGLVGQRAYQSLKLGKPPVPLKKDLLYLTAIAGGGQGEAGSVEEGTYHLQRGSAKVTEESVAITDAKGKCIGEETRSHTQITMCIVEPGGRCTELVTKPEGSEADVD